MAKMKGIDPLAYGLTVVGGLNWGLVQFMNVNVVEVVSGALSMVPMVKEILYGAVAASALYVGYDKFMK